jgi:hypothetical protein
VTHAVQGPESRLTIAFAVNLIHSAVRTVETYFRIVLPPVIFERATG